MRVFISHSFDDEKLAMELKSILETSQHIEEAYLAQKSPDFELEISEKIIREIQNSDYLVAIITKYSKEKPSVHQELGYAQGVKTLKIPLVEKGAIKGVLLEGKDYFEFEKSTYSESCQKILNYILKHGPKRKYSLEEGEFIQRSAHYRYELKQLLDSFIHGILILDLKIFQDLGFAMLEESGHKRMIQYMKELTNNKDSFFEYLLGLNSRKVKLVIKAVEDLSLDLSRAERFPHNDLLTGESDVLIKLQERVNELKSPFFDINTIKNLTKTSDEKPFSNIIKNTPNSKQFHRDFSVFSLFTRQIIKAGLAVYHEFGIIKKKYGELAFKDSYDSEAV